MFIITTKNGERKRLEIPDAIERAGKADDYAANPPADAWALAEVIGPNWPHADAVVVDAPAVPDALNEPVDDAAPLSDED